MTCLRCWKNTNSDFCYGDFINNMTLLVLILPITGKYYIKRPMRDQQTVIQPPMSNPASASRMSKILSKSTRYCLQIFENKTLSFLSSAMFLTYDSDIETQMFQQDPSDIDPIVLDPKTKGTIFNYEERVHWSSRL